jgi:adenosylcobinamide-phosphate synthase
LLEERIAEALLPLALGLALDAAYPSHSGPLLSVHPVHTSYVMAMRLQGALRRFGRAGGAALWALVVGVHALAYGAALWAAWRAGMIPWILISSYVVKVSVPVRLLFEQVGEVGSRLGSGDLSGAREAAQGLVRRQLASAGAGHVASAAIESLFESLVDGVTSPLLYYLLLGPIGALLQRLSNTMDGAVGFRDPQMEAVGWFSAKVDTALNYVPARLTAMLEVLACRAAGGDAARALRTHSRYGGSTPSANAGHPMSAAAGCLGVRLEKAGEYALGEGELPGPADVGRGLRLAAASLSIALALYVAALLACAAGCPWVPWAPLRC